MNRKKFKKNQEDKINTYIAPFSKQTQTSHDESRNQTNQIVECASTRPSRSRLDMMLTHLQSQKEIPESSSSSTVENQ